MNILKDRRTVAQEYFFGPVTTSGRPDTTVVAFGDWVTPFQALHNPKKYCISLSMIDIINETVHIISVY